MHAERKRRARREMELEMAITLSSDDERGTRDKKYSRLKPAATGKRASSDSSPPMDVKESSGRYKPGENVESRFGGRSKWFPAKVLRAYHGPQVGVVYDIAYEDGDMEEGVLAGRVRRPGQSSPVLQPGLEVDVKLARKGKGFHHGVIGRVDEDGRLYVKFVDGDSEWGVPVQHVIASYAFIPVTEILADRKSSIFSGSVVPVSPESCGNHKARKGAQGGPIGSDAEKSVSRLTHASSKRHPHETLEFSGGISSEPVSSQQRGSGGLNWIAELANSTRESTPPVSGRAAARGQLKGEGGGSGLNKIGGLAPMPFLRAAKTIDLERMAPGARPAEGSSTMRNPEACLLPTSSSIASVSSVTPTSFPSTPRAATPPHLTWKPSKQSTKGRRWGAPPPDDDSDNDNDKDDGKDNDKDNDNDDVKAVRKRQPRPPQVSGSAVYAQAVAARPAHSTATTLHATGREGANDLDGTSKDSKVDVEVPVGGTKRDGEASTDEARESARDLFAAGKGASTESIPQAPRQCSVVEAEIEERSLLEQDGERTCDEGRGDVLTEKGLGGQATTVSRNPPKSPSKRDATDADGRSGMVRPLLLVEGGEVNSSSAEGFSVMGGMDEIERDGPGCLEDLRASVQRRCASDAVHLSEEVRLLRAKLQAAEDSARAKLAQQARETKEEMREALERERERASEALRGERVVFARKIKALTEEVDNVKRRLLAKQRNPMTTTTVGDRAAQDRRRHESSAPLCPTCEHATSRAASRRHHAGGQAQSTTLTRELGARKRLDSIGSSGKSERSPPPPPARLIDRNGGHTETAGSFATVVTRECWRSSDPSPTAVSILGPATVAEEDPVSENLDELSHEEMASREESIRVLTGRLEGIEGSRAWALTSHEPSAQTEFYRDSRGRGASSAVGSDRSEASAAARRLNKDDGSSVWRECSSTHEETRCDTCVVENLRRRLAWEQRESRRRLETMKENVDRVVQQFRARADRAEASAASAEERARVTALRYLSNKGKKK